MLRPCGSEMCFFLQNPGFRLEKEKQQRVEFEATLGCTHPALVHCHKQTWATGQGGFAAANKPNLGGLGCEKKKKLKREIKNKAKGE